MPVEHGRHAQPGAVDEADLRQVERDGSGGRVGQGDEPLQQDTGVGQIDLAAHGDLGAVMVVAAQMGVHGASPVFRVRPNSGFDVPASWDVTPQGAITCRPHARGSVGSLTAAQRRWTWTP
jgi:hypothetical protein